MRIRGFVFALVSLLFFSCGGSDENSGGGNPRDEFDRAAMLTHWADQIIIPVLEDLDQKLDILQQQASAFQVSPDSDGLTALKLAWLEAYKVWQYAEMFNIGKAEEIGYLYQMNVYPANITDIENNIAAGVYDLAHPNNNDAVGFPAIDYLLYGSGANAQEVLSRFTEGTQAAASRKYLEDLTVRMKELNEQVLSDWKGGYRNAFVSNSGNTATSSVNKLTNDFIYYFERGLRANKIGIPAGVFSATPLSDRVEAYHSSEFSRELAQEAIDAVTGFFNGKAYNGVSSGPGFASYLDYLNGISDNRNLSQRIRSQLQLAAGRIDGLLPSLATQVTSDNTQMTLTFDELQKVVVLFKVEMVQAMNISIDYVDADGD